MPSRGEADHSVTEQVGLGGQEPSPVKRFLAPLLKAYSIWASVAVCLFLPIALLRIGTVRDRPVRLASFPALDGSLAGRSLVSGRAGTFHTLSVAGGPWIPAGGVAAVRQLADLPAGTVVSYRATDGTEISGAVQDRAATASEVVGSATFALLALVLCLTGTAIAVSGAGRQALLAGGALAGLGHFAGHHLLEPAASLVSDPALRNAVVLAWVAFPRHLVFLWLAWFLSLFPTDLSGRGFSRGLRVLLALIALGEAVLVPLFQVPGVLETFPVPVQALLVVVVRGLMRLVFAAGVLGSLVLVALQLRAFRLGTQSADSRRRAQVVGLGLLAGLGPPLAVAVLQLALSPVLGRPFLPRVAISISFLPILAVPLALSYAMLAPRVQSVGLLARKALLLGFAEKTIRIASLVPLVALVVFLYRKRQSPIGEVFSEHALFVVCAFAASIAGLRWGGRAREALEHLFFRTRGRTPEAIARIAEETRRAGDVAGLAEALAGGVERALVLEQAGLFVRDESAGAFVCLGRPLPALDASSPLVEEAAVRDTPLHVGPEGADRRLSGLGELERHWLESAHARLVVPLRSSSGDLIALLVVGEKTSELPFEPDDEQLLLAAASSGALALENLLLRTSHGSSRSASSVLHGAPPRPDEAGVVDDSGAARFCRRCSSLFAPTVGNACPDDETLLELATVPHLLAGKYRLDRRIGAGGMGVVFRARDLSLGRDVAIKTLPRLSRTGTRRLQREARAGARLIHPHLGLIFAAESWRGTPMLVLEYLPGGTLSDRIRKGAIPSAHVASWGADLAGALDAAHGRGILHRDIKPSNVGFTADGAPKLLDFGLVRLLDEPDGGTFASVDSVPEAGPDDSAPLTASSRVVGTVPYLSPEALQGYPPVPGFDLWSLALTLYEALTGTNPFARGSNTLTAERILQAPVPDPRSLRPDCPPLLAALLLAALARSPLERPATARELRRRLEAAAGRPVS